MRQTYTALEVRKIRAKYTARIAELQRTIDTLGLNAPLLRLPVKTPEQIRDAARTQG